MTKGTKKPVAVADRAMFDVTIEQYSFRNLDMTVSERERSGYDVTIHRRLSSSSFTQSAMTRAEIAFMVERLQSFLEDTSRDQNLVYLMECGHEFESPYRLTRRSRGHCSQHGFQKLAGGEFLPTWRAWVRGMLKISRAARDDMYEDQ